MKPIFQTKFHIKGEQNGNCWAACLASIFECDINVFPDWENSISWADHFLSVCAVIEAKGYEWGQYTIENTEPGCLDKYSIDGYVIAIGKSPRSTPDKRVNHAVVWKNGIAYDPHPDKTGIQDIISFEVFYKINNPQTSER